MARSRPAQRAWTRCHSGSTIRPSAERAARLAAVAQARTRAEILAEAAGVSIVGVSDVVEGGAPGPGYPQPKAARMMLADSATPVEAGTTEISVTVTVTFRLAPTDALIRLYGALTTRSSAAVEVRDQGRAVLVDRDRADARGRSRGPPPDPCSSSPPASIVQRVPEQ